MEKVNLTFSVFAIGTSADGIEPPLLETPGPRVAPGAQLPAPAGESKRRQAPMTDLRCSKSFLKSFNAK